MKLIILFSLFIASTFGIFAGTIESNSKNPKQKIIALCFDDGPFEKEGKPNIGTAQVLDILKSKQVKATFFVMGKHIVRFPNSFKRIIAEGHQVENHTFSHKSLPTMSMTEILEDIQKDVTEIKKYYSKDLHYFRAPFWQTTGKINKAIHEKFGYFIMNAANDKAINDWGVKATTTSIYNNAMKYINLDKLVLVIHCDSPEYGNKLSLIKILDSYKSAGFKFVTLDEYAQLGLLNKW